VTNTEKTEEPRSYTLGAALREDWPVGILFLLALAAAVWIFPTLPERVPVHWNIHGAIDGWGSRAFAVFGMLGFFAGIYALLVLLPLVDPRRGSYSRFLPTYRLIRLASVVVFVGIWGVMLAVARGVPVRIDIVVPAVVSVLFIILGNVMGRVRQTWFIGIRTPWSLANEEAWRLTHRASGPVWVVGGIIGLVGALIGGVVAFVAMMVGAIGAGVFSVVYSYFAYKKSLATGSSSLSGVSS